MRQFHRVIREDDDWESALRENYPGQQWMKIGIFALVAVPYVPNQERALP